MSKFNPVFDLCAELYAAGSTMQELAAAHNLSIKALRQALIVRGVYRSHPSRRKDQGSLIATARERLNAAQLEYAELRLEWMCQFQALNDYEIIDVYKDAAEEPDIPRQVDILLKALGRTERRRFRLKAEPSWHSPLHEACYGKGANT